MAKIIQRRNCFVKQSLSGSDWRVSPFLPDEVGGHTGLIGTISAGNLYGGEFIAAAVPGDVQSDALDAGIIDDINYGFQARNAEWTSQRDWVYLKSFLPDSNTSKRTRLVFDGIDYACEVFLNGKWLGDHEGAFEPFSFDITDRVIYGQENQLVVVVKSAPMGECQWGYTSKVNHLKPRFAYGWDWCTRLVPLGIWKDVYLVYDNGCSIEELYVQTKVDYRSSAAEITAKLTIGHCDRTCIAGISLTHPDGKTEIKEIEVEGREAEVSFTVADARLWYPNGLGEQPLYLVSAHIPGGDPLSRRIGLRHIEWQRTQGAGEDALSYQPYINGLRVYLQGYNWTPLRQLYGRTHTAAYAKRVKLLKLSGANYIRIWGGGLLEREELYNLCDENGILIMQELFQSSATGNNHPPRDENYIDMICRAAKSAILQKRHHPSLISWCGGNELCFRGNYIDSAGNILIEGIEGYEGKTYNVSGCRWIPLSADYPTLMRLRDIVAKYDAGRMFFHTSGSGPITQNANLSFVGGAMHDVHGPWTLMGPEENYAFYNRADMMIHHEFGFPAPASVQTMEEITPKQYLWPLNEQNPMLNYHGRMFGSNYLPKLNPFFGEINDHRTYALAGRFLQWEQSRYALEAHRRLGKKCAGSCLWHYGEPWPCIVDNCVVDYRDQVKPAFYGHISAFKPLHLAAFYDSVIHKNGFRADFALFNSTSRDFCGSMKAELFSLEGQLLCAIEKACFAEAYGMADNIAAICTHNLPDGVFFLRQSLYDQNGTLTDCGYSIHSTAEIPYRELITTEECDLEVNLCGNKAELTNKGKKVISALTLECDSSQHVIFSDGCCMLLPNEKKTIELDFAEEITPTLFVSGFGIPYRKLDI